MKSWKLQNHGARKRGDGHGNEVLRYLRALWGELVQALWLRSNARVFAVLLV